MSKKEFERILKINSKKIRDSMKRVEDSNDRFNEIFKKILRAL